MQFAHMQPNAWGRKRCKQKHKHLSIVVCDVGAAEVCCVPTVTMGPKAN